MSDPSDFRGDWYSELTNQLSHAFFGFVLSVILNTFYYLLYGTFPEREYIIILFVLIYFFGMEVFWQRNIKLDSFVDTWFVALGCFGIFCFKYIEPTEIFWFPMLLFNLPFFLGLIVIFILTLIATCISKIDEDSKKIS